MRITKLLGGILILVCLLFIINNPMGREESPQIESSVVLRLSETKGADYPSNRGVQIFAAEVEKRSNGRIIIEIVDEGGLGSEKEVIEQVQFGGIDLARVSLLTMVEYLK